MLIKEVKLYKLGLKLKKPFVTGFGTIAAKETLIVQLTDESGIVGFGEAASLHAPIYNEESVDICHTFIKNYLTNLVLNKEFNSVPEIADIFDSFIGNNIAKSAVEFALWDIVSKKTNTPLSLLFGGVQSKIEVGANSIGIQKTYSDVLELISRETDSGLTRIKLKIRPGWDIELLDTVRSNFPDVEIMVDANSSYVLDEHWATLKQLDNYNLLMIEQPLSSNTIYEHALLQQQLDTPICLDESIKDEATVRDAVKSHACKIVNIKPARVGGVAKTIKINQYLKDHSVRTWCGGMLETSIGRAFNIALASLDNFSFPADISPYDHYFEDIVEYEPFPLVNGAIATSDKAGIGFEVDTKMLALRAQTVETLS